MLAEVSQRFADAGEAGAYKGRGEMASPYLDELS
jgi:hypothetical protein